MVAQGNSARGDEPDAGSLPKTPKEFEVYEEKLFNRLAKVLKCPKCQKENTLRSHGPSGAPLQFGAKLLQLGCKSVTDSKTCGHKPRLLKAMEAAQLTMG